ncbi:MAG: hypothetical protein WC091_10815 [Sulfuricellaceae bacterium]|jgi:hypothetical protein
MRNFDNFPVIAWDGKNSALRARAQVMHGEPLILEMGSGFDIGVDAGDCGCRASDEYYMGCDPKCTLSLLAEINHLPALAKVGEAAQQAGLLVDVDGTRSRIIIYD